MQRLPLRELSQMCEQLRACGASDAHLNRAIAGGIRTRVLTSATLPMLVQRLDWRLALRVLQCDELGRRGVTRDANLWPAVERSAPCVESRAAARNALRQIFTSNATRGRTSK